MAELSDKPVFVHPGPARGRGCHAVRWWAPVVDYVAQLQAAWWAWHAFDGRLQFPRLRLVFAAGAGLAPVHHERLTARGGRLGAVDPDVFVDTSSYGAQGLDALTRALGIDALVLGQRPAVRRAAAVTARRGRDTGHARRQPVPGARAPSALRSRDRRTDGGSGMSVAVLGVPAREATPLAGDLTLDTLPGRDLDQDELRSLASSLALHPELWRHHLAFDDDHRVYVSLYRDAHVDVWLLCWTPENDTGFHDHDISSGAVAVVSGTLAEHNLARRQPGHRDPRRGRPGLQLRSRPHPPAHRCRPRVGVGPRLQPAAVADGSVLRSRPTAGSRRQSVSYADELRPHRLTC